MTTLSVMHYAYGMNVGEMLAVLRSIAPERLAEPWDKVGPHVGDPAWDITRALLCIDLTPAVMAEAVERKANLIVAYHPPIFTPLERLTSETWKGRVLLEAAHRRIAIYSPHTALDAAAGGVNDWLADGVGEGTRQPIKKTPIPAPSSLVPRSSGAAWEQQYKLVTFIPPASADAVRTALSQAGAGHIGDYTQCSFSSPGEGTFEGGAGTHPAVGEAGQFERVAELRLEMVVPRSKVADAVAALRNAHPYEEPAFDLIPLATGPQALPAPSLEDSLRSGVKDSVCGVAGQGRVIELDKPVSLDELVERLRKRLSVESLEVAKPQAAPPSPQPSPGGRGGGRIQRVGLCAGAGGSLLDELLDAGQSVDAFFTGEMRHHDVLDAVQRGIAVILAGHTQTERPYLPVYRQRILDGGGSGIEWTISAADRPPSRILS